LLLLMLLLMLGDRYVNVTYASDSTKTPADANDL